MFALASRSVRAISSPTSSGTCEPPGASRKTNSPCSDEKRLRTALTSRSVVLIPAPAPASSRLRSQRAPSSLRSFEQRITLSRVEERELGGSGIRVSRVILGCGNFGGIGSAPAFFGQGETREQAFALMDAAWDAGITTFDTADAYGGGRSETWIGEWRATKGPDVGERLVLSTKVFHSTEGDPADTGLAPERVRRQLTASLRRLGVERVDMYLTHNPDPDVAIAETLGAFDELVAEGLVRAYGVSNVDGPHLRDALAAGNPQWVQNSYSLLDRDAEAEVLPLCAEHGLGFTPFSPLAGGWLTGKYRRGAAAPAGSRMTLRPE